jgi:HEPN domain-containing protein
MNVNISLKYVLLIKGFETQLVHSLITLLKMLPQPMNIP